jgi:hypothetical protein
MNVRKPIPIVSLLVVMSVAAGNSVAAQLPLRPPASDAEMIGRYTPVEIQDYREAIRQTFVFGHEVARVTKSPGGQKLIEQRMQLLEKASDADLARLMSYGADFGALRDSIVALRQSLKWPEEPDGRKIVALSSGFPDANYDFCGSTHGSASLLLQAQVEFDVAKGVWSTASRACDQVLVVAGEGGNTSLICIIVDTALWIGEATFNAVQFCENDIDSAEINGSYRRLDHIHSDLATLQGSSDATQSTIVNNNNSNKDSIVSNENANKDAIVANDTANKNAIIANDNANRNLIVANDNANKDTIVATDDANRNTIVANDNSNRDTIVNNDNANRALIITNDNTNRDLIISNELRLAIELSLSAQGSPLALFELPAPSGYLELAGSIVRQSIDAMKANNQTVFEAERFYAQAVVQVGQGSFKLAFKLYQTAYREATK